MSFVYRDGTAPALARSAGLEATFKIFDRLWYKGRKINGEEVYEKKLNFYYKGTFIYHGSKRFKKFLNTIGSSEQSIEEQDYDSEIETVYFELNTNASWDGTTRQSFNNTYPPVDLQTPDTTVLAHWFNNLAIGDTIQIDIVYGGSLGKFISQHDLQYKIGNKIETTEPQIDAIKNEINEYPWYYLFNTTIWSDRDNVYQSKRYDGNVDGLTGFYPGNGAYIAKMDDNIPVANVKGKVIHTSLGSSFRSNGSEIFALFDTNEVAWTETDNNVKDKISTKMVNGIATFELTYSRTFTKKSDNTSYVMYRCEDWFNGLKEYTNLSKTKRTKELTRIYEKNTVFKKMLADVLTSSKDPINKDTLPSQPNNSIFFNMYEITNSLYLEGHLRRRSANEMKRSDFGKILGDIIKTDYDVEESEWWEAVLAVAIIVIAVVLAVVSFGAAGGASAGLVSTAAALSAASLTLTIGSLILSTAGGLSASRYVKTVGIFAEITGLAAMFAGITAMIQTLVRQTIREARRMAIQEAMKETGKQLTYSQAQVAVNSINFIDTAMAGVRVVSLHVVQALTFAGQSGLEIAASITNAVTTAFSFYDSQKQNELKDEIDEKKALLETLDEFEPSDQFRNPGKMMEIAEEKFYFDAITDTDDIIELSVASNKDLAAHWASIEAT